MPVWESAGLDADPDAAARQRDRCAIALGLAWFAAVMLIALGLWVVEFQVAAWIQELLAWGAGIAVLAWILRGTPSSSLSPDRRARRDRRRMAGLVGGSSAAFLLGVFVAAFQLRSWSQWVVLASMIVGTIGVGITLHSHLLFRRR